MKTLFKLFLVILQFGCQATVADSSTSNEELSVSQEKFSQEDLEGIYTVTATLERLHLETGVNDTLVLSGFDELKSTFYSNIFEIVMGETYSEKKFHKWDWGINYDTVKVGNPCMLNSVSTIRNDSIIVSIEICRNDGEYYWIRLNGVTPIDTIKVSNFEDKTEVICDKTPNCNSTELVLLPGEEIITISSSYLIIDENTLSQSWAIVSKQTENGIFNKRYKLSLADSLYTVYNQADSIAKYDDLSVGIITNTFIKQ